MTTKSDIERAYERWLKQSRNVEALMGVLRDTERHAIDVLDRARKQASGPYADEFVRANGKEQARQVAGYTEIVREAARIRNMVEAEVFGKAPPRAPARVAESCKPEG